MIQIQTCLDLIDCTTISTISTCKSESDASNTPDAFKHVHRLVSKGPGAGKLGVGTRGWKNTKLASSFVKRCRNYIYICMNIAHIYIYMVTIWAFLGSIAFGLTRMSSAPQTEAEATVPHWEPWRKHSPTHWTAHALQTWPIELSILDFSGPQTLGPFQPATGHDSIEFAAAVVQYGGIWGRCWPDIVFRMHSGTKRNKTIFDVLWCNSV